MINGNQAAMHERPHDWYGHEAKRLLERAKGLHLQPVPRGQEYMVLIPFMHQMLDAIETLQARIAHLEAQTKRGRPRKQREDDDG